MIDLAKTQERLDELEQQKQTLNYRIRKMEDYKRLSQQAIRELEWLEQEDAELDSEKRQLLSQLADFAEDT